MSLRPPSQYAVNALASGASANAGLNVLDYEIAGEKAAALGRAGEQVEKTLARLRAVSDDAQDRSLLLRQAAQAVYAYFIQRELHGIRRHHDAIVDYGIPKEVLARLGAS